MSQSSRSFDKTNEYERESLLNLNEQSRRPEDAIFENRKTDWKSMWIIAVMQFVCALQISVHSMSMWPYLLDIDKEATTSFLGWAGAMNCLGNTVSLPLFGLWNQKSMSVKWPGICGMLIAGFSQLLYSSAYLSPGSNGLVIVLVSRLLTGLGVGNMAVFRTYAATASLPKDRMKAISMQTASIITGFSVGPVISAAFTFLGSHGIRIGVLRFSMYNTAGFAMVILCIASCIALLIWFNESYVGILGKSVLESDNFVIPRYNVFALFVCGYSCTIATVLASGIAIMSSPLTQALYGWSHAELITYNGILNAISCLVSILTSVVLSMTLLQHLDKRVQILIGSVVFLVSQVLMWPWSFYPGPLRSNTTENGLDMCPVHYEWCEHTHQSPHLVYILYAVLFMGVAFALVENAAGSLLSEVIGPRKQGLIQGIFGSASSLAPFFSTLAVMNLFSEFGYGYVILLQATFTIVEIVLVILGWSQLVPVKLKVVEKSDSN
ncbi:unnamed protein product [Caenorhabditis bovis]|uniref:Major facilitator superfamily (MFS) profile domain-containing protein n=1 Tax=Caenorhabditis bovis TaxID=2654633 RepID=A0A8S1E9T0_9PELO|nr:unnamed protein product [Caenorhabditis bovis]